MSEILEHDEENGQGLPEPLPGGERVLWRGKPRFARLVLSGFHARKLALYFGLLLAAHLIVQLQGGAGLAEGIAGLTGYGLLAAAVVGLIALYAWLVVRSTLYTVTSRRIVIRGGVALPITINLPYTAIASADLRCFDDGSGDIALTTTGAQRASYLLLWPHLKMRRLLRVQPMLRALADAEQAAAVLGQALAAYVRAEEAARQAAAERPAEDPAATASDERPVGRRWRAYPTIPLAGAVGLVVITVVAVVLVRIGGESTVAPDPGPAVAALELRFEDRPDGSVAVFDAADGALLDTVESGEHGFLRATMRSLANARRQSGAGPEQPFTLMKTDAGRLLLIDSVTDRRIDLWAFGETNARSFSRLFTLAEAARADDSLSLDAPRDVTALALTKQETRP